jgi:ATP-binding cassette subfamily B protein
MPVAAGGGAERAQQTVNRQTSPLATKLGTLGLSRWALGYAVRHRLGLAAVVSVMLVKIGLDVIRPWPMKALVDYGLGGKPIPGHLNILVEGLPGGGRPHALIAWCVAASFVVFLAGWAVGLAGSYAQIGFGQRMTYDLAGRLFGRLQQLSLQFHSRRPVGDSIRRVTGDCSCVSKIVRDALLPALSALIALLVMFGIMWQMDATLTVVSLAVVPMMVLTFRRYAQPMMDRSYAQAEVEGRLYSAVEETLSAIPVVQAFGAEERADRRLETITGDIERAAMATASVQLQFKIAMGLATATGTASILWIGARHVLDGDLTIGSLLVFLSYLASLYAPLEGLMYAPSTIHAAAGSARRVLEVLAAEEEVRDIPGAQALGAVRGHVRLDGVTFGYEAGRPVLQGVSVEALPGETVAIVGPTGAGKSTLVSLVPRFFDPWAGKVTVDRQDVRDVQLRSLRSQVALVLQEPFLFPLTVAENIAYGRPGASRGEVEAAARAANAHAFIERLPAGYATVVGERGGTLSGGERQRLAIARALLKDAPILILDEPTSALDAETEASLMEALERLMRGRTTLIIAHRLSTIRRADRIVVLAEGAIQEVGTHQTLLTRGGLYAGYHDLSAGSVVAEEGEAR